MMDHRSLVHGHAERGEMPERWWYRIFGTNDVQPEPAALLEELQRLGFEVTGRFRGDDRGWFAVEIAIAGGLPPLQIERYLSTEDDIRAELSAWAAWLETQDDPQALALMEHMTTTTQMFTLRQANPIQTDATMLAPVDQIRVAKAVCQFLARLTQGVYQIDEMGIFAADGTLLVQDR
jgi:hypothetical protein